MATRTSDLVRATSVQGAKVKEQAHLFVRRLAVDAPGQAMMFAILRELVREHGVGTMHRFVDDARRENREDETGEREFDEHDRMLAGKLLRVCEKWKGGGPKPVGFGDERYER